MKRFFIHPQLFVLAGICFIQVLRAGAVDKAVVLPAKQDSESEDWLLHGASTFILQGQPGFRSPYAGENSLPSGDHGRETFSFDIYAGARLWPGAEFYVQQEYYQGFGFHNTRGIAAFPNGEAYKTGSKPGLVIWPHIMLRQTFGFGGEQEAVEGSLMQIAGKVDVNRLTVTMGRFAVFDQFDVNTYAHDSRGQFMNWALLDAGAFDYAADSYGYTQGLSLELNQKNWALRYGFFLVPKVSNGIDIDYNLSRHWQQILELETRYKIGGHAGKTKLLGWVERANMGSYEETLLNPALNMDITQTRRTRTQSGVELNMEQELASDLGSFLRLAMRDGRSEVWAFTDIDRSLTTGLSLKGKSWGREKDTAGLAWVLDGLSSSHRAYTASGGLGPLIGDGKLNYGLESVIETYYDAALTKWLHVALDYQLVTNPGYNKDRGPVNIFSVRLHCEF